MGHKDDEIKRLKRRIVELEKQTGIEPLKGEKERFGHNRWDKLQDVGEAVVDVIKDEKWIWVMNSRCKYVSMRIDMRSGHCILVDREGNRISIDQLKYQYKSGDENE